MNVQRLMVACCRPLACVQGAPVLASALRTLPQLISPAGRRPPVAPPQLAAREAAAAEGQAALAAAQRQAKELETHKFVLTHRVEEVRKAVTAEDSGSCAQTYATLRSKCAHGAFAITTEMPTRLRFQRIPAPPHPPPAPQLQRALAPQEGAAAAARERLSAQERELLGSHSALLAARRAAGESHSALRALKAEAWEAKQLAGRQGQLLGAFAGELFHVRRLLVGPFVCLFVCLLVRLSVCLFVCLFGWLVGW